MKINQIDVIDGFKKIDDATADIILADPPYNIGKDFGISKDDMDIEDYLKWSDKWIGEAIRVLKKSGTLYIYGFAEILAHLSVLIDKNYKINIKWLVWHYTNKTVPRLNFWQRSHESILCCWKDSQSRIFNTDDVREPYTDIFLNNAAGKVRKNTKGRYSHSEKETIYTAHDKGALPRDVIKTPHVDDVIKVSALAGGAGRSERWFFCNKCNNSYSNSDLKNHQDHKDDCIWHPTQKPYELTKRLLLAAKPKDSSYLVIPFVGSGAECAVAEDLGIEYCGFEINPDYIKLANSFLKNRKLDIGKEKPIGVLDLESGIVKTTSNLKTFLEDK